MKIKKSKSQIYLLIAVLMVSVLVLSSCGLVNENKNTLAVVDCVGRTVLIPEQAQKIAALDPFAGQALIMLGYGDKMVATVGGVQRDLLLQYMSPTLADAVIVKESGSMNAEAVLSLGVDLIFVSSDMHFSNAERQKLDKVGIPYLVIEYFTMEEQCEALRVIGNAISAQAEAEAYVEYYLRAIEEVSAVTATIPDDIKPSLYHSVSEAVITDAAGSFGADWIAVVGAKNVSLHTDLLASGKNYSTTLEQIFVWDPDLIICNETGVSDYIMGSSRWLGLRAVREGRVYQIPIGVSRMGHPNSIETPLAIRWLAELLYPDYFPDFDFKEELRVFYQQFFDYEIDDATIDKIIDGEGIRAPGTGSSE